MSKCMSINLFPSRGRVCVCVHFVKWTDNVCMRSLCCCSVNISPTSSQNNVQQNNFATHNGQNGISRNETEQPNDRIHTHLQIAEIVVGRRCSQQNDTKHANRQQQPQKHRITNLRKLFAIILSRTHTHTHPFSSINLPYGFVKLGQSRCTMHIGSTTV